MIPSRRARLVLFLAPLALALGLRSAAADAPPKSGYTVVMDIKVNDKGVVEDAVVSKSDDTTIDHVLDLIAMEKVHQMKPEVHMKDGHPVPYTIRAPFVFPIEGDEGPESNLAPRPSLHGRSQVQPTYPPEFAAKGQVGGAILEIIITADGSIRDVTLMRASNPEFGAAAVAGVKQWHFTPAMKDGVAVSSRWRLAVVFETDVAAPDWEWRLPPRPSLGSYTVMHRTLPLSPEATAAPAPATLPPAPVPGK